MVTEIKRAAGEVQSGANEISSGNVNLSERSQFELFPVVGESLLGKIQRTLFHFQVLAHENKIPVCFLRLSDKIDQLLLELHLRHFLVVLRNADGRGVDRFTEIAHQVLIQ